ncbi:MOSC domain-containing protein [Candidatus Poseidoniaceae archaeon]|jgi:MOSC domain-containing protein YiiM|nr:MOSC domain-containing protein [Candidatus Poseidoniaceae archaeon]|tara:strand:+ start:90 stop:521 length:432 start_codon:yes stop_codon:yes gene_type:complete
MGQLLGIFISNGGVPKDSVISAEISLDGLVGDNQNDKKHHGGPLKAVCILENELLVKLKSEGHPIQPGTTGENLLVEGFNLDIGSIFQIDEVQLEVVSAATPCKTISESFKDGYFNRISHKKYPGETRWYCKVLKPGQISRFA